MTRLGDKNMPACTSCVKAGIQCVRALQVRFRSGLDSTDEFAFSDNQIWVQPESNCTREFLLGDELTFQVEYCDETAQLSQIYETEDPEPYVVFWCHGSGIKISQSPTPSGRFCSVQLRPSNHGRTG